MALLLPVAAPDRLFEVVLRELLAFDARVVFDPDPLRARDALDVFDPLRAFDALAVFDPLCVLDRLAVFDPLPVLDPLRVADPVFVALFRPRALRAPDAEDVRDVDLRDEDFRAVDLLDADLRLCFFAIASVSSRYGLGPTSKARARQRDDSTQQDARRRRSSRVADH